MDEFLKAKHVIKNELDSVVKVAASSFSSQGSLSGDANQAICNVIEAVFIHGLKDAFFLKGSRYSKYPEPNFWPFVSKFTHRSIKNQIDALKQIKNEIGKARAWVRIVMNEGALEHYINLLAKDSKQLNLFYMKGAFLSDYEMLDALTGYLKALSKIPLSAPTNSCFLNSWTPSPLILAGLISGKPNKLPQKTPSKAKLSSSLENEETEVGMSALDLLDDSPASSDITPVKSMDKIKALQNEEDEDKSSVYSHPSMLDGGLNFIPFRPNYSPILASTPENSFLNDPVLLGPSEELSSEVIVQHRRTHFRKHSKSSSEGGNSRKTSRSRSHSTHQLQQFFNDQPEVSSISEMRSIDGHDLLDPNSTLNTAVSTVSSTIVSEAADSGIVESPHEEPDTVTDSKSRRSTEVVFSLQPHPETHEIITEADKRRIPILSESLGSDQQIYGTSLHDELQLCAPGPTLSSSGPSAPSTSVGNSLASRAWTIPSSKDSSFERDRYTSFSSSVGTENSDVFQTLDTALKNAMKNYDDDLELEKNRNDSFNARFYELTEQETSSKQESSESPTEKPESADQVLEKVQEIEQAPLVKEESNHEENEPIVIEEENLDGTDEYGIPRNLLALLTKIPTEKGLDAQEFRCPSCRKSIGGSFSSFKLCNLDCRYYCEECWKRGDESIIPSRLILNWDTRLRPISKASKAFLKSIADRPLIRIDKLNENLYKHSKQMDKILKMREKLSLVAMYLLSCKQSVAEDLKRRLWPNHYLYSDIHLYSVTCAKCFAVFHIKCIEKQECPKCLRKAKYSVHLNAETSGSTLPLE